MTTGTIADMEAVVAEDCRVEIEAGTAAGQFEPAADCQVEHIVRAADGQAEYALLRVRCDVDGDVLGRWSRARRVAVVARRGDGERYLFCGPPLEAEWRMSQGDAPRHQVILKAEGLAPALQRCADLVVIGRFVRPRWAWSADGNGDVAQRVSGLECLFSPDGRVNCAAWPIAVTLRDGSTQEIHVFTHEDDPDAQEWTVARALRYLAWFHLRRHPWLDIDGLLAATQAAASAGSDTRSYLRAGKPLESVLRAVVTGFVVEGSNAIDALSRLVDQADLHWHIEPVGAAGLVRCEVRLWSDRQGPARCLPLSRDAEGTLPGGGDAKGEVGSCTLRRDLAAGVQRAIVVGDVKYHEVTVALMPGWAADPAVDAVAYAQRPAAKAEALLDEDIKALGEDATVNPWFQKYHRKGSAFVMHQDTGRKWVLNEHGRYLPALYNRYAPFSDYQPFRFATVLSPEVADAGRWLVRPRKLLPPITQSSSGQPLTIAVEVSFDGGWTWSAYTGPLRVLADECSVAIEADNLCEITPPGITARQHNLWYALIDQQARVRVTALIEADERLEASAACTSADLWSQGRVIQADRQLPYATAAGAVNALRATRLEGQDVDSTGAATAMAAAALNARSGFAFEAVLPGMRLDVGIGQRIWGFDRPGTQLFEDNPQALPCVRRIEYAGGARPLTTIASP